MRLGQVLVDKRPVEASGVETVQVQLVQEVPKSRMCTKVFRKCRRQIFGEFFLEAVDQIIEGQDLRQGEVVVLGRQD